MARAAPPRGPHREADLEPLSRERFDELVERAVAGLPPEVGALIESVEIGVQARPGREAAGLRGARSLLGLYVGPTREEIKAGALEPARIVLYQRNLEALCKDEAELAAEVARTLRHELGHYFGFGDRRLRGLGH